eukprot:scaffold38679_cov65-Phaeocystis_antarctica.AAC.2
MAAGGVHTPLVANSSETRSKHRGSSSCGHAPGGGGGSGNGSAPLAPWTRPLTPARLRPPPRPSGCAAAWAAVEAASAARTRSPRSTQMGELASAAPLAPAAPLASAAPAASASLAASVAPAVAPCWRSKPRQSGANGCATRSARWLARRAGGRRPCISRRCCASAASCCIPASVSGWS